MYLLRHIIIKIASSRIDSGNSLMFSRDCHSSGTRANSLKHKHLLIYDHVNSIVCSLDNTVITDIFT